MDSLLAGISPANVHNRDPRELLLVVSGARVTGNGVLAQATEANVLFLQMAPWTFTQDQSFRRTYRQSAVLFSRLLANLGLSGSTGLLERFATPIAPGGTEQRWLQSVYLDTPVEWDDPYRFFRW